MLNHLRQFPALLISFVLLILLSSCGGGGGGSTEDSVPAAGVASVQQTGPTLYAAFPGYGLWKHDGTSWSQLTPDLPEGLAAAGTILFGDFGSLGLWKYNGTSWSQLTPDNPENIAASGSALYGDFGALGLWKHDGTAWSQLTPDNPQKIAVSGSTLYGDFGTLGLWKYDGTNWSLLTPDNPENIAASGSILYGDFGTLGLWKYDGANWSLLTPDNPENIAASGSILYGDFGTLGLWKYDGGNWSQLTPDNPENIAASGSILYGDFGTLGLWKYDGNAWSLLTSDNPSILATIEHLPITAFSGTQSPGDFWSWTIDSGARTFSATNVTKSLNYSGTSSALAGNSAGISKLSVTNTSDTGLTPPQSAYAIEVANTALMVAHAPFYTAPSGTQQSTAPPIFAAARGSCPSTGVNVNWINMPRAAWCSSASDPNPMGNGGTGCTSGNNAFGTAAITVSGSTYGMTVNSYKLDGTADPSGPLALSGCSCSNGVILCTDSGDQPVRISFTPSGVFFADMQNRALAGIVQPSTNVDLNDFLKSGRTFRAIYHTALDSSQIFTNQVDCTSHGGVWISGTCGTHTTQPATGATDGTSFIGHPYSNIDNGTLSTQGGSISFATSSQATAPGLVTGTFNDFGGGASPIAMVVRQVNNKYVGLIITHSPNATLGGGFNVLAVEQ